VKQILIPLLIGLGLVLVLEFGSGADELVLEPGRMAAATLDLRDGASQLWSLQVPEGSHGVEVQLFCAQTDLDIRMRRIRGFRRAGKLPLEGHSELGIEELILTRFTTPAIEPGAYEIEVFWDYAERPYGLEGPLDLIDYELAARVTAPRVDAHPSPGIATPMILDADSGGWRTLEIEVPEGAAALRVDLLYATADLDLFARRGEPVGDLDAVEFSAETELGSETLLITADDDPPLRAGTWYVDVVGYEDFTNTVLGFAVVVSFQEEPPAPLLRFLEMPEPEGDSVLEPALCATVEILTPHGSGSGTVVTPDGWILTNAHVVSDPGDEALEEVVIAVTRDRSMPPQETFRGRVREFDMTLDLALVEIVSGLYDQPLPEGYRFPVPDLAPDGSVRIGDPIWVLGYPVTGGSGSRVSITVTRGVISGWERSLADTWIKCDAEVTSGNSGGAALDALGRLLGVPTSVVAEGDGKLSYIAPLASRPSAWRGALLRRRAAAAAR